LTLSPKSTAADVLIVGAGPAGSALALALQQRGFRTAIVERAAALGRRVGETIPGLMRVILEELGLWDGFLKQGHRPCYERRSAWGQPEALERSSIFEQYGEGFQLDRAKFDRWLQVRAQDAGAELVAPARIAELLRGGERIRAICQTEASSELVLDAGFVVDATGASHWVSRRFDAERRHAHRMVGVARWYACSDVEPAMLIEAVEDGWWYSAPVPGRELVLVWITDATSATVRVSQASEIWEHRLNAAPLTRARLSGAQPLGPPVARATGPSITMYASNRHFLPIGDAAATFDPISGEGLCFALRSALEAARAIEAARAGDASLLEGYRDGVARVFAEHLELRKRVYAMEQRFSEAPFWKRAAGAA
jgi:flavin-dependent dehydrogenase